MGCMMGFLIPIGIYTTSSQQSCSYIAQHSECEIIIVEDKSYLERYTTKINEIPKVKYFILINDQVPKDLPVEIQSKILKFQEVIKLGNNFQSSDPEFDIEIRFKQMKPGNCCSIIYTSGTTGYPKGVMLSHDNYHYNRYAFGKTFRNYGQNQKIISILPMSHIAGQNLDIILPIYHVSEVYFPTPLVLQTKLISFLQEVKPTFLLLVPRLWEKMYEYLLYFINTRMSPQKRIMLKEAQKIGAQQTFNEYNNLKISQQWKLYKNQVINDIKKEIGLQNCKEMLFGASPLQPYVRKFFMSLNIRLVNCYGMSELSGGFTFTRPQNWKSFDSNQYLEQAGVPMVDFKIQIDPSNGEICCYSRGRFMGYFKNESETTKTINEFGMIRTGDSGYLDKGGNLFITGRIKELIKTSGGQFVSPLVIEKQVLQRLPILSYVVVIGEKKKYVTALLTLRTQNGNLIKQVFEEFKKIGSSAVNVKEAVECPMIQKYIQQKINEVNQKAYTRPQRIQKFTILTEEFSILNVLTPTMKLRRHEVEKRYKTQIQNMYIEPKL